MPYYRHLLPSLLVFLFLSACSEDDLPDIRHHVNPLWTPDGKTIVAGYDTYASSESEGRQESTLLLVKDFDSRVTRVVDLPEISTWHTLYTFDPSGTVLAFAQRGRIIFYDLQGNKRMEFIPSEGGDPRFMEFSNTGNSFIWLGATPTGYTVHSTTYDAASWTTGSTTTIDDVATTDPAIALTLTSQRSCAVRQRSGAVREIDFSGVELNSYLIGEVPDDNPWREKLLFYSTEGRRYLYAIDEEGMYRMDLDNGDFKQLVKGNIINFDVSSLRRSMLYETRTGDTWLSSPEGTPLSRLAPMHIMPRFSPAANGIALVERIDDRQDSLKILLLR
ncbi:MAG: hypothetical protein KFH87_04295 [Bacteroidetes bacterium]|nr:hypothetical protein [Bacteroidota bacterium]